MSPNATAPAPVPPALERPEFMMVWRVIAERMATLTEIRQSWTIDDVLDANDVLTKLAHDSGGLA